jgi:hypothetical protein
MALIRDKRLLGDRMTAVLEALGMRHVVDALGMDCGCENRKKWLNDLDSRLFRKDSQDALSAANGIASAVLSEEE